MAKNPKRLHSLFLPIARAFHESCCWHPSADVYRARDAWLVKFDLAGVRPEDISLSRRGPWLILRGSRRDASAQEGRSHYRLEIAYSEFERSVELPFDLESAEITWDYRDGMLMVRIQAENRS
jgi:HSP20 family protein